MTNVEAHFHAKHQTTCGFHDHNSFDDLSILSILEWDAWTWTLPYTTGRDRPYLNHFTPELKFLT
jgi:hypothetical protein